MKPMIVTCSGGCYSLAYEINGKVITIRFRQTFELLVKNRNTKSNFDKTVRFHMDRGCVSSLPFALQKIETNGDWRDVTLNDKNFGIKGTIKAMISGKDQLLKM